MSTHNNVYTVVADKKEPLAADEILAKMADGLPSVPYVVPSDSSCKLPDTDLLNAIHYYIALKYPERQQMFDDSALLALGIMVENWVEETLDDGAFKLYTQTQHSLLAASIKQEDVPIKRDEDGEDEAEYISEDE